MQVSEQILRHNNNFDGTAFNYSKNTGLFFVYFQKSSNFGNMRFPPDRDDKQNSNVKSFKDISWNQSFLSSLGRRIGLDDSFL